MTRRLVLRTEVYSVRAPVPDAPLRGYARCLDCGWWVATLDPASAVRAANDHDTAPHATEETP